MLNYESKSDTDYNVLCLSSASHLEKTNKFSISMICSIKETSTVPLLGNYFKQVNLEAAQNGCS